MGKVYVGQEELKIEATLNEDITGATPVLIKYRKPSGTTGSWAATITDATTGVIEYEVNADGSDIDEAGEWTFWGFATMSSGRDIPGEAYERVIYTEGQ
ncbi:hypothetical protein KAR91_32080 [Candidatus Pacearchaeota archaeon]|nr:hypothetical protein [Candidatus Pacearchaeota archaeon]